MRKVALIISILGLGLLLSFLFDIPLKVNSLDKIKPGTVVRIEGLVTEERTFSFGRTLSIGDIEAFCVCKQSYLNKSVEIIGVVEDYYTLRLQVLQIKIQSSRRDSPVHINTDGSISH